MTIAEILARTRRQFLDDTVLPYKWSDAELYDLYTDIIDEFCEDSLLIFDQNTEDICTIPIIAGTQRYALDSRVISVQNAKLSLATRPLHKRGKLQVDPHWKSRDAGTPRDFTTDFERGWIYIFPKPLVDDTLNLGVYRYQLSPSGMNAIDISMDVTAKTITKLSGGFLDVFKAHDIIELITYIADNQFVSVASLTDTVITVNEDLSDQELTPGTVVQLINLSAVPEIREQWQNDLFSGICSLAYGKQDSDTYDPKKAATYATAWTHIKSERKIQSMRQNEAEETFGPLSAFC